MRLLCPDMVLTTTKRRNLPHWLVCSGAVYEDSSIVYPNQPTLNTGGCPYRGLTYRPSYMRSLNPSVECAPAPDCVGCIDDWLLHQVLVQLWTTLGCTERVAVSSCMMLYAWDPELWVSGMTPQHTWVEECLSLSAVRSSHRVFAERRLTSCVCLCGTATGRTTT